MVVADSFTGEKFLTWPRDSQESLIQSSIMMTGIIAAQHRTDIAGCIDDWYTGDEAVQAQRHEFVIDTIRKNPSYHPQGVILALLQKECGSFAEGG